MANQNSLYPKLYIASPFGFSEATRYFYEQVMLPMIEDIGYTILDPWALAPKDEIEKVTEMAHDLNRVIAWREINAEIGRRNTEAINTADAMIAVLDGTDPDSGTCGEIGYAAAQGKRILGYRGDFRQAGDNEGGLVNLQIEHFIHMTGGQIVTDMVDLREVATQMFVYLDKELGYNKKRREWEKAAGWSPHYMPSPE